MIPAKQLLNEIVVSLRNVIGPAITDPYPKAQAYMAAVILEFVSRQVEERSDIADAKREAIAAMFQDISHLSGADKFLADIPASEAGLCELIERLYAEREHIGEEAFAAAKQVVRHALRQVLDQELKIAGKAEG